MSNCLTGTGFYERFAMPTSALWFALVSGLLMVSQNSTLAQAQPRPVQATADPNSPDQGSADQDSGMKGRALRATKTSGPVVVTTRLEPAAPVIGDEIVLTIEVAAAKDVEVLMPEFSEALQSYTIVDFVPREQIAADGSATYSQRYALQPYSSGAQAIPPILIEFRDHRPGQKPSPDDYDVYEILTDRMDFEVQSVIPRGASPEMRPPSGKLELPQLRRTAQWVGGVVALLGLAAVAIVFAYWKNWRATVQRANAYELARQRLDRLLKDQHSELPALSREQFFVEISSIIRRYLEDRYRVQAPDLTTDEFLQLTAGKSELSRDHQNLLGEFLQQADIVKFAGVSASAEDIQRSSDLAVRFLEETRQDAPEVEVSESDSEPLLGKEQVKGRAGTPGGDTDA